MSQLRGKAGQPILDGKLKSMRDYWTANGIVKRLLEIFPSPAAIIDGDGRFLEVNEKLVKIAGLSREELVSLKISDIIESAGRTSFPNRRPRNPFAEAAKTNVLFRNGKINAEAVVHVLTWGENPEIFVVFNVLYERDKTLARIIEERTRDLMKSEEKLRSIFEYSPDAIVVTDLNGIIIDCNQAMLEMYRFPSKEEVIGRDILELVSLRDRKRVREDLKHTLSEGPIRNIEYTFLTEDGYEFPVEFSASVVLDTGGNALSFVIETKDITERKIMEEQLKQHSKHLENLVEEKTKQLREAERLSAIGELAAMIGHDLRNPLMGIAGAAYYLKQKLDSTADEKTREMLNLIKECIEYSNKIVNDLLDYSREIRLELENVNPRKIIAEALSQISIPDNITVINRVRAKPKIKVDVNKMKRVIINVVKNAIEAMPNGGRLEIKSKNTSSEWKVSFSDTGIGIPEEIKEKLGKPLFTTKAKGMGLGLAICKRIVEAHGGSISLESSIGKGTVLTISIPINSKLKR